jgi:hypothetical protein
MKKPVTRRDVIRVRSVVFASGAAGVLESLLRGWDTNSSPRNPDADVPSRNFRPKLGDFDRDPHLFFKRLSSVGSRDEHVD